MYNRVCVCVSDPLFMVDQEVPELTALGKHLPLEERWAGVQPDVFLLLQGKHGPIPVCYRWVPTKKE